MFFFVRWFDGEDLHECICHTSQTVQCLTYCVSRALCQGSWISVCSNGIYLDYKTLEPIQEHRQEI